MKHSVLWAAMGAALLSQGALAQTTSGSASNANSGSVSGATAVSSPTVNVAPTSHNNSASTSSSGAVSGSMATGGQGGAGGSGGAGGVSIVTSTPTSNANSSSSTSSNSTASTNGNTQVIQFLSPPETTSNQNIVHRNEGESTQRVVTEGGTTNSTHLSGETTQRIEYSGTQTIKNVPSVQGPPLTTSNDTCMGSSSGSINGPGFGIGLGSTWTDRNCVMLKNARELWNMGMKAAAMALFCTDSNNRMALEITGFVCPQTAAQQRAGAEADRVAQLEAEKRALAEKVAALERANRPQQTAWRRGGAEYGYPLPSPVLPSIAEAPTAAANVVVTVVPDAKVETAKVEPVKVESAKVEPVKVEPVKVEPVKVEAPVEQPPRQFTIEKAIVGPVTATEEPKPTVVRTVSQ